LFHFYPFYLSFEAVFVLTDEEEEKPGPSSTPHPEKTPAKETDFYDLPDGLSDNEEQAQGQVQRSGS